MNEIEKLNFSEADFKLLNEGLECLPNKDIGGELMIGLLSAMVSKDDPDLKLKMDLQRKQDKTKADQAKALMIEEVRILQGKVLMLQRYLRTNGLLKDAHSYLNE